MKSTGCMGVSEEGAQGARNKLSLISKMLYFAVTNRMFQHVRLRLKLLQECVGQ